MLQPRQDDLLARLLDLAGEEYLIEDGVDFVEVEDEVEFADVAEEGVEDLDEEVDGLEEGQLVVVGVDAGAKEEPRVPPVDNLVVAELDEVGLVFLVARRYEAVNLMGSKGSVGRVLSRRGSGKGAGVVWDDSRRRTSPLSLIFSSSLYGTYHLARRVLPLTRERDIQVSLFVAKAWS